MYEELKITIILVGPSHGGINHHHDCVLLTPRMRTRKKMPDHVVRHESLEDVRDNNVFVNSALCCFSGLYKLCLNFSQNTHLLPLFHSINSGY